MTNFTFDPNEWLEKKAGYNTGKREPIISMNWRTKTKDNKKAWSTNRFLINQSALKELGFDKLPNGLAFSLRDKGKIQVAFNPPPHISAYTPQKCNPDKPFITINNRNLVEETLIHLKREDGLNASGDITFDYDTVYDQDGIKVIELRATKITIQKDGK